MDSVAMKEAQERQNDLTKPQGSLGRLEEVSIKMAGIQGSPLPELREKVVFTFAGDHGVVEEDVSAYPGEVTRQMVLNFAGGGAAINVLARHVGARVVVADLGVKGQGKIEGVISKNIGPGTGNFALEKAMSRREAERSIEAGIEVFEESYGDASIVALGDMGIGNTTPSSAICSAITGKKPREVTGRGTGVDEESHRRKVEVIERALQRHRPDPKDALDVLSKVGGYEIGGLAGVALAAASHRVAVVADGFISTAGALLAYTIKPEIGDYLFAGHRSVEVGHRAMLEHMGLDPLLDLNLRLGEGTGAALAMNMVEAGVKVLREMATFSGAGVSRKGEKI